MNKNKVRSLIVAYGEDNRVIGDGKKMPNWRIKDDMDFFKETTSGHVVIMGRKNYESLHPKFRPLPNRTNIILTRDTSWEPEEKSSDILITNSWWDALEKAEKAPGEKIFIIGGGQIYRLALNTIVLDELHITTVVGWFDGTVTFPRRSISIEEYTITYKQRFLKQENRNSHEFVITSYLRNPVM